MLWDTDTQNDIILQSSPFAVPGGYTLMKNFGDAISFFEKQGTFIMGSVDAHIGYESVPGTRDENLPLHCIKGTTGQLKITSTQGDILFVSNKQYDKIALDLIITEIKQGRRVYFEKEKQSCEDNPNIEYIMRQLGINKVYIMGAITNVCIKYADKYFKNLGLKTYLVRGAIKGNDFPNDTEEDAINAMLASGSEYIDYNMP